MSEWKQLAGKFNIYYKYGVHGQPFFGSRDKLRNRRWGYRIYLVSGGSSYNPNDLKLGQHVALSFTDLAKSSLRAVWITHYGMNHQEAQKGTGEKSPVTCNHELIFILDNDLLPGLFSSLSLSSSNPGWPLCKIQQSVFVHYLISLSKVRSIPVFRWGLSRLCGLSKFTSVHYSCGHCHWRVKV